MRGRFLVLIFSSWTLLSLQARAQSAAELGDLRGLAPVTVLLTSPEGKAALDANLKVTGGIQTGTIHQSTLLPFPEEQELALQDATITGANLADLADGLGTTLGAAYLARAHCSDAKHCTEISKAVAEIIAYATTTSGSHSNAGKYLFANETKDGTAPVSDAAAEILSEMQGQTDVFGKAYNLPAGSPGADKFGDSRPFQTEPTVTRFEGTDYFNVRTDNTAYNRGPMMNLVDSPSYPSGHTTYGYTGALLLSLMVPERYQQMIARGAEYGNDRIIVGAHYAMDVLGGRALAMHDVAHLLANDPEYAGQTVRGVSTIRDFRAALAAARTELTAALQAGCGKKISECAREDIGRFSNAAANADFYGETQTYNLGVVYAQQENSVEDVGKLAHEAGYLLTFAFPSLTLEQADRILTETEGPGGGFLDTGSEFGVYSRLNLYAAAERAKALETR